MGSYQYNRDAHDSVRARIDAFVYAWGLYSLFPIAYVVSFECNSLAYGFPSTAFDAGH